MRPHLTIASDLSLCSDDRRMQRSRRMYTEIGRSIDVIAVSRVEGRETQHSVEIAPGLIEHRIPRTAAEVYWQNIAGSRWGSEGGDDALWFARTSALNPPFVRALADAADGAAFCICLRPYAFEPLRALTHLPIVYDALELEYPARVATTKHAPNRIELLESVARSENACVRGAAKIISGSAATAQLGALLYDVDPAHFVLLSRALDLGQIVLLAPSQRKLLKAKTNLANRTVALFEGSCGITDVHDAVALASLAGQVPEIAFLLVGPVAEVFPQMSRPPNLSFTGPVNDATRELLFQIADVYVHAGTLKRDIVSQGAVDAALYGLPLMLTPEATANTFEDGREADIVPSAKIAERLRTLLSEPGRQQRQTLAARKKAEKISAWSEAVSPVLALVNELAPLERCT